MKAFFLKHITKFFYAALILYAVLFHYFPIFMTCLVGAELALVYFMTRKKKKR